MDARGAAELKVKKCNHTQMLVLMSLWNNLIKKALTISYFGQSAFQRLGDMMWERMIFHQQDSLIQHSWPVSVEGIQIKAVRAFSIFLFPAHPVFLYFNVCFKNLQWLIHWSGCVYTVTYCFSFFHFFQISVTLVFCPCWDSNVKVITNKSACLSLCHVVFCLQPSRL